MTMIKIRRSVFLITKKFGERIKYLRNEIGISQEKFALSIDMDRTYYTSVENGRHNISIKNITKIFDGLGISLKNYSKDYQEIDNGKKSLHI